MKKIVIAAFVAALFASAFSGCTLHEEVEIEIIRPPQVQDTVTIPDWELKEYLKSPPRIYRGGLDREKSGSVEYDRIADAVDVG